MFARETGGGRVVTEVREVQFPGHHERGGAIPRVPGRGAGIAPRPFPSPWTLGRRIAIVNTLLFLSVSAMIDGARQNPIRRRFL